MGYINPDYPMPGEVPPFQQYTYGGGINQQANAQPMYYGGTGCYGFGGYQAADPESRRAPQQPYGQPMFGQNPFATQQPAQPYAQPLQAFSSYGGSGAQAPTGLPVMPTLDSRRTVSPTFQAPTFAPQQTIPTMQWNAQPNPQMPMICDTRMLPLFTNGYIPSFDRTQQNWDNSYVAPREMPMPTISWNKPVQEPQFNYLPAQSPFAQQPSMQMTWTEIYNRNKALV